VGYPSPVAGVGIRAGNKEAGESPGEGAVVADITPSELQRLFPNATRSVRKVNGQTFTQIPSGNPEKRVVLVSGQAKHTDEQKLNKTEKAYLAVLRSLGVKNLGIQNITLKIADDCRFTPDFNYLAESGVMIFVDVKGFQREDAFIKIKVAARMFPQFGFQIVKKDRNIGWDVQAIKP